MSLGQTTPVPLQPNEGSTQPHSEGSPPTIHIPQPCPAFLAPAASEVKLPRATVSDTV